VATHFFQDLAVSLGKKGESLQDPSWIWQRSATEISKNLPRDTEPFDSLRNYRRFRNECTEPFDSLRNYPRFRNEYTELSRSFVSWVRNLCNSTKPKKALYENYETILVPRNLKWFGGRMRNFTSSVKHLFF
jgi:hypothetical protein